MPASEFWDREVVEQQHVPWMAVPAVRLYINARVGNGELLWPLEAFEKYLQGRTFDRALSIGCGAGALERNLVERGMCGSVDAFDGSIVSLREARTLADAAGLRDHIRYFAADFNRPAFPRATYDLVAFHQSAHHVAHLEKLYRAILRAMKRDAMLYLDEYVGPSRFEWEAQPELLDVHRKLFAQLPRSLRRVDELEPPIQADDPSEAIRSSEIESQLRVGFDVLGKQPYGGGILSIILPNVKLEALDEATLNDLIERDRAYPAFYALIAAKPKIGWRRAIARARYWLEPKTKRLRREIAKRMRRG